MRRWSSAPCRGSGFTLLELLIVLAMIAVVAALLVSAVHKVRESNHKINCTNNLSEIGKSFNKYHQTHGHLPPGGTHFPRMASHSPYDRPDLWSWAYQILPYLGEEPLYEQRDHRLIARTRIAAYICPARRGPDIDADGKIDYAGCAGSRPRDGVDGVVIRTGFGRVRLLTGIPDGLTNTIMVAEKQLNLSRMGRCADDNEDFATPGWNGDFEVYRVGLQPPAFDYRADSLQPSQSFGSSHDTGINLLFADGSVRVVRYTVSPEVFRGACVRNDNVVNAPNDID